MNTLSMFLRLLTCDETGMVQAARNLSDCNVVRTEPWNWVSVITLEINTEAKLSVPITPPREHFRIKLILCLDVYYLLSFWRLSLGALFHWSLGSRMLTFSIIFWNSLSEFLSIITSLLLFISYRRMELGCLTLVTCTFCIMLDARNNFRTHQRLYIGLTMPSSCVKDCSIVASISIWSLRQKLYFFSYVNIYLRLLFVVHFQI